ncbi:MAG: ABC transporter ATP-binding protein, partial [Planctomycetota bacterium]
KQLREQMQYEIKHIHENLGVTVVYVTHDQAEALTMSDRIAVFNDGVIQQLSSPDELYERPESSFVAQFIGENNKLNGRVVGQRGDVCDVQLTTGETVRAKPVNTSPGDASTTLSLRPERVEIEPSEGSVDSMLTGEIRELIYLGDHIRTRMAVAGNEEFIVKVPNSAGHVPLAEGTEVKIGWKAEDCRALDPMAA